MSNQLLKPFIKEEVEKALNQMTLLKSLGPNSFWVVFYQKQWKTVGTEVSNVVLSILNGDGMSHNLNSTFIALIPKKCNADFVTDFKPISLCNVLYKLISKVLTNRFKPLMHAIISNN